MSDFAAFEKLVEGLEGEERIKAILAAFDAKVPMPSDPAVRVIGTAKDIAWWDHETLPGWAADLPQFDDFRSAVSKVPSGGIMLSDRTTIPPMVWASHREDYAAPGGQGLKLEDAPAVVALVRNAQGRPGLMIGYKAAA